MHVGSGRTNLQNVQAIAPVFAAILRLVLLLLLFLAVNDVTSRGMIATHLLLSICHCRSRWYSRRGLLVFSLLLLFGINRSRGDSRIEHCGGDHTSANGLLHCCIDRMNLGISPSSRRVGRINHRLFIRVARLFGAGIVRSGSSDWDRCRLRVSQLDASH